MGGGGGTLRMKREAQQGDLTFQVLQVPVGLL